MTAKNPCASAPRGIDPACFALFLDVDGTLLDIAPHPDAVIVEPGLLDELASVERALNGAVALLSGRPIADLDKLFAPLRLAAGGVHGAELRRRPGALVTSRVPQPLGEGIWDALQRLLREFPGTYAENKRVSFAVHYPDPGTDIPHLRQALLRLIECHSPPDRRLRLAAGQAVFEVQLPGFDKGQAIEWFAAEPPFRGRLPVFIGDDEIDRPGFDKALALGGLAFSVGAEFPGLSGSFASPAAVRAWLRGVAR